VAITMKYLANALLILCLLAASCEAKGLGRRARAGAVRVPRRTAPRRDPNEKVFNVLQYGAKPGGKQDSALVRTLIFWILYMHVHNIQVRSFSR
jgi:galacturan 1,4-alpha-galacturonidase